MATKPTPKRKYIVVDFAAGTISNVNDLDAAKGYIQTRADEESQDADWVSNNFMVYEIKEQLIFTAQEEIAIQFGIG